MLFVGIDWGDAEHHVALYDAAGQPLGHLVISLTPADLIRLRAEVKRHEPDPQAVRVAVEGHPLLLVSLLAAEGYQVYPLNPKAVQRLREGLHLSGAKSDRRDAADLATLLALHWRRWSPLAVHSPLVEELRLWVRSRDALVAEATRLSNQLTAALKSYYPRALELFSKVTQPLTLAFLRAYPTPAAAAQLTQEELFAFLRQQHYPAPRWAALCQRLQGPQVLPSETLVKPQSTYAVALAAMLQTLLPQIAAADKAIAQLFAHHPEAPLFDSLPGAGPTLAPRLLAELGDDPATVTSPERLQRLGGTAPVTKQSGARRLVAIRRACQHSLRHTLQLWAGASLPQSAWARDLYRRHRSQGKGHHTALRIVAHRWIPVLCALRRTAKPYDETTRRASREHHQAA